MIYEFEHSVECPVDSGFAWRFWSNVENWAALDSSVESVKLNGAFAAGTKGETKPRGASPTEWELIEVRDGESAVIGINVPGALLKFHWTFEAIATDKTLISQRLTLEGKRAADYAEAMTDLEKGVPAGMRSLANGMIESGKLSKQKR